MVDGYLVIFLLKLWYQRRFSIDVTSSFYMLITLNERGPQYEKARGPRSASNTKVPNVCPEQKIGLTLLSNHQNTS